MRTTERFENAVTKLYNAFHSNELNAVDCKKCAVGNIVNGSSWQYIPMLWDNEKELISNVLNTGYSSTELRQVEYIFMMGRKYGDCPSLSKFHNGTIHDKESQFKGLCAVVEYLCELDSIPDIMDYTKLFETENEKPKYQLS